MRNQFVAGVALAAFFLTAACGPAAPGAAESSAAVAEPAPAAETPAAPVAEPAAAAPAESAVEAAPAGDVEPVAAPAETAAPAAPAASPYATANLEAGKQAYMIRCRACHAVDAAAGDLVGPNLDGVFQRKPGSKAGFRYSEAMVAFAGSSDMHTWRPEEVDEWLAKPTDYLPGSAMFFNGIKDAGERRNLIGYLLAETAQ